MTPNKETTAGRILLIDDEADILGFLARALGRKGYQVECRETPAAALELFEQVHFDLVLVDWKLPGIDGLEVLKKVKESSPLCEVILMTAYPCVETAVASLKLGAFDYLIKPFTLPEALTVVDRAFQHLQAASHLAGYGEMEKMKETLIRNLGHELRTPLGSIHTASSILLMDLKNNHGRMDGEAPAKILSIIQRSADRLLTLMEDLMETFRFENGKIILKKMPLSAERLVAEIHEEFLVPCQERGIDLQSEMESPFPPVEADPVKLRQVLINLLGNAMKFTPAGGRIRLSGRRMEGNPSQGSWIELAVEDSGIGIEPEQQKMIFEKFYQIDQPDKPGKPGLGLGLALVKAIVVAHGGFVQVFSTPGSGSTFIVRLPARAHRTSDPSFPEQAPLAEPAIQNLVA